MKWVDNDLNSLNSLSVFYSTHYSLSLAVREDLKRIMTMSSAGDGKLFLSLVSSSCLLSSESAISPASVAEVVCRLASRLNIRHRTTTTAAASTSYSFSFV